MEALIWGVFQPRTCSIPKSEPAPDQTSSQTQEPDMKARMQILNNKRLIVSCCKRVWALALDGAIALACMVATRGDGTSAERFGVQSQG